MNELLTIAVKAALKGGGEILRVYGSAFQVDIKEDKSPLTEADRQAHLAIKKELEKTGMPLLSEEGRSIPYSERSGWQTFWLVDPLDGTKEFIKRNGEFTVNIALIENGKPVLGVIYVPVKEDLYCGVVGEGAWKGTCPPAEKAAFTFEKMKSQFQELPVKNGQRPFTVVASRSHMSPETEAFIEGVKREKGEISIVSMGSSLKICLVAEGAADVYPRFGPTMEWDTAAGHAIAKAARKNVVDQDTGTEMAYNKENLLNNWFIVK